MKQPKTHDMEEKDMNYLIPPFCFVSSFCVVLKSSFEWLGESCASVNGIRLQPIDDSTHSPHKRARQHSNTTQDKTWLGYNHTRLCTLTHSLTRCGHVHVVDVSLTE